MDTYQGISGTEEIVRKFRQKTHTGILKVNCHVHSPYSFSAFENMDDLFLKARLEGINVLGINDFNGTDGFEDFWRLAEQHRIYPLFNIELIGLLEEEQKHKIRINDPNNPGRIYFCGKGLRYPFSIQAESEALLQRVRDESRLQVMQMTELLQSWLQEIRAPFGIGFREIRETLAKDMVRERHIAKMLRMKIGESFRDEKEKRDFLKILYGGQSTEAELDNAASLEEEIRGRLLKSGGVAFVAENPAAFLPLHEIITLIRDAGGIPCYPVLLDDKKGGYTEFEADFPRLISRLEELGIAMVELIPGRNDFKSVKHFVQVFTEAGFIVSFGTEHNTPVMTPLTLACRGNVPLDEELQQAAAGGSCLLAAHQYLVSAGGKGLTDPASFAGNRHKAEYIELGHAIIDSFINQ